MCGADGSIDGTIVKLRRVFYVFDDEPDCTRGPLEVTYDDGRVEFFDAGADGQTLRIGRTSWVDPFTEPLSTANVEYIRTHGKWLAFDVTKEGKYNPIVGQRVLCRELIHQHGACVGVMLHADHCTLSVRVEFDELIVELL